MRGTALHLRGALMTLEVSACPEEAGAWRVMRGCHNVPRASGPPLISIPPKQWEGGSLETLVYGTSLSYPAQTLY